MLWQKFNLSEKVMEVYTMQYYYYAHHFMCSYWLGYWLECQCMINIIHEPHPPCSTDGASCRLVVIHAGHIMWFTIQPWWEIFYCRLESQTWSCWLFFSCPGYLLAWLRHTEEVRRAMSLWDDIKLSIYGAITPELHKIIILCYHTCYVVI